MEIINAVPEDAPLIAKAIMTAVGTEICENMAGENHSLDDVAKLFTELAGRNDSQYSWRNTRIAVVEDGKKAGVCVCYDGKDLKKLRRSFFELTNKMFGWGLSEEEIENIPEETKAGEYYLDSLMVLPEYRKRGIASALIEDAHTKARSEGLPLGLLVDPDNPKARHLYDSLGFKQVDIRPFAGVDMNHLLLD